MLIGAHVSAAGGLHNGPVNAAALGIETFQFFSRPPQGGKPSAIDAAAEKAFRNACEANGFARCYIHAPYVINLASKERRIREGTIDIVRGELERGSALGATAVMFHPGSASGVGEEEGVRLVIEGIKAILRGYKGTTRLLVEISAGAGMVIGDSFEEVGEIIRGTDEDVGVCFDTAHAFASGYDLRTPEAVEETMTRFDRLVGLDKLVVSHCNDSKVGLGERKDRHEHLGHGHIGRAGFEAIVASPRFTHVDFILETPIDDGMKADIALLKEFRK